MVAWCEWTLEYSLCPKITTVSCYREFSCRLRRPVGWVWLMGVVRSAYRMQGRVAKGFLVKLNGRLETIKRKKIRHKYRYDSPPVPQQKE